MTREWDFLAFGWNRASSVGVVYNIYWVLGLSIYSSIFLCKGVKQGFSVQHTQLRTLLIHLRIHDIRSQSELDATCNVGA